MLSSILVNELDALVKTSVSDTFLNENLLPLLTIANLSVIPYKPSFKEYSIILSFLTNNLNLPPGFLLTYIAILYPNKILEFELPAAYTPDPIPMLFLPKRILMLPKFKFADPLV
nr:MAG TPA: hypothetical protein [Caudoviricetes sp.]